jgi:hypothetical protein
MADPPQDLQQEKLSLLSPRKLIIQLLAWLVGLGLLAWIIRGAAIGGDWTKIRDASPLVVAALLGCTVVSAFCNGATFWITVQSLRPLRFWDMQRLNLVGNILNYAPIRLGAIARVMYHLRVDRLRLLEIGAWFALIGYVLLLGVGACLFASLIHNKVDWIWAAMVAGQLLLGGLAARVFFGSRLMVRYGGGVDKLFSDTRGLWSAIALRVVDLSAYTGRMAAALAILGTPLPASHIVVLATIALAASLIPFGRVGFREFCVAAAATRLGMQSNQVESTWQQLALIESAGEALIYIPAGALALLWYRKRWRNAGPRG